MPQQLDIFADALDVQRRNAAAEAVARHDLAAARQARDALAQDFSDDHLLPPLDELLACWQACVQQNGPCAAADQAADRARQLQALQQLLTPVLGHAADAGAWMSPHWRRLAQASAPLSWSSAQAQVHAAAYWLAAAAWPEARAAAEAIPSWPRIPQALAWVLQARHRELGLEPVWPLVVELAVLAPTRLEALLPWLADARLDALREQFDRGFEAATGLPEDLAWFPAWLLTEKPKLAQQLSLARRVHDTPGEQALTTMLELLGLERQGGRHAEIIERRKHLGALQPALLAAYMRTR